MSDQNRTAPERPRARWWAGAATAALGLLAAVLPGCPAEQPAQDVPPGQVRLTLLHTSDIHSRLFPYDLQVTSIDSKLGLGPAGVIARIGGAARIGHVLQRERARADRVLHLDGGDCFQGAPIYNFFTGEAEMRVLTEFGTDAMIVANHEFDNGALNLSEQIQKWTNFPILAANYRTDDASFPGSTWMSRALVPWTSFNLDGLKVGVIGLGNLTTLGSLFEQPNSLGLLPYNTEDVVQFYTDLIRPMVDVVVIVSHIGLEFDERMIENTSGVDVVLGGHNHIVLQPPKQIEDCKQVDEQGNHYINVLDAGGQKEGEPPKFKRRRCNPRKVILSHAGAFAKFVGRLDLTLSNDRADMPEGYDPINGHEVVASEYKLFPITEDIPEDVHIKNLLRPYKEGLDALIDLDLLVGYAPDGSSRTAPGGGDSALGNMVATAMWLRQGVQTDFSLTNSAGIRAAMVPGPISIEQLYNIFPFDNSVSRMNVSGVEVQKIFDFVARRSASRGCVSQVQIAGARVLLDCGSCSDRPDLVGPCASDQDCSEGGECNLATGTCIAPACARKIYIGSTTRPCKTDSDCGANKQGACDNLRPDAQGFGRCFQEIDDTASYELATSNYLAQGGSGFRILRANTTQFDTRIQQRDALTEFIRRGRPCGYSPDNKTSDGLKECSVDADCGDATKFACACVGGVTSTAEGVCETSGNCGGQGRCVLRACRNDVAAFHRRTCASARTPEAEQSCEQAINPCELGGESCKFLACVDDQVGNFTDNRIIMVGK
jgi:5'-nucleotidase